jgi:uncharacterized protein
MAQRDKVQERWQVEDRRGGWQVGTVAGWVWLVGIVLVLAVWYFGGADQAIQLREWLQQNTQVVQQSDNTTDNNSSVFAGDDTYEVFVSKVIWSTNTLWKSVFKKSWYEYTEPKLVLFRWATQSACGGAQSQVWPHYCPMDETIYVDETFFTLLEKRFGAQWGDLAQAYVLAHEVGHHVQHQLWLTDRAEQRIQQWDNTASIALELQADCLAGIWVGTMNDKWILEENDLYEAIDAAEAVGDDSIQEKTAWYVQPETRTHGSSEQRKAWLSKWYTEKNFQACDTSR